MRERRIGDVAPDAVTGEGDFVRKYKGAFTRVGSRIGSVEGEIWCHCDGHAVDVGQGLQGVFHRRTISVVGGYLRQ